MRKVLTVAFSTLALLLVSCGQQHDAESVIKDFMSEHLNDDLSVSGRHFTDLDSTHLIGEKDILRMRHKIATSSQRYDRHLQYAPGKTPKIIYTARVKYYIDTLECSDTYYLDKQMTRVIAFKEN